MRDTGNRGKKTPHQFHWVGSALLVFSVLLFLAFAVMYNFTQDDAYITFRYVDNYVTGHGLVFNVGERVEGYTNFLWLVLLIPVKLVGLDLVMVSRVLGVLCGIGTLCVLYLLAGRVLGTSSPWRGVACVLLGAAYSFAYWAVAGLETAAFALAVMTSLYMYLRRSYVAAPMLVVATLLRPEGALVLAFLVGYEIVASRRLSEFAIITLVVSALGLIPYAVFKLVYFGGLLPNPFYAKAGFTVAKVGDGIEYVGTYFWHYLGAGAFLLPALYAIFKKKQRETILLGAFAAIYIVYIILIGGDVLKVHRFFVPIMPVLAVLAVAGWRAMPNPRLVGTIGLAGLLVWQMIVPRDHVNTYHFYENELTSKMRKMADNLRMIDSGDFSLAVSTIGVIGYYLPGHIVIDVLGLTDTTIARYPEEPIEGLETTWRERHFNTPYLLSRNPDYILFSTGMKPSAPAERALFLYSAFLRSYRTVGFSFGGVLHDVYKRYYAIAEDVSRDIDVGFVQNYNKGMNYRTSGEFARGIQCHQKADKYLGEMRYQYTSYCIAELYRLMGDHRTCYMMLKDIMQEDSLIYQVYKDLYYYEYSMTKNMAEVEHCRKRLLDLVPWYVPRLDSLVGNL
ncbi:MAG: hypothetical protein JW763_04550 [candidate division Zixibacteria bacterium]|nr:hypothetical protein [candidate division Zixibacteria bacterium]